MFKIMNKSGKIYDFDAACKTPGVREIFIRKFLAYFREKFIKGGITNEDTSVASQITMDAGENGLEKPLLDELVETMKDFTELLKINEPEIYADALREAEHIRNGEYKPGCPHCEKIEAAKRKQAVEDLIASLDVQKKR